MLPHALKSGPKCNKSPNLVTVTVSKKAKTSLVYKSKTSTLHSEREQRTLTVGGRINVWLVSSLTRLELANEGNIILFAFSETV